MVFYFYLEYKARKLSFSIAIPFHATLIRLLSYLRHKQCLCHQCSFLYNRILLVLFKSICRHNSLSVYVLQSVIGKLVFFVQKCVQLQITSAPFTPESVTSTETSVATSVTPGIVKVHNITSSLFGNSACCCSFIQYALYTHCN